MSDEPLPIYTQLKNAGVPLDNHESDLHAKVTPESTAIIDAYRWKWKVRTFKSNIDGALWYDVPFAWLLWYEGRRDLPDPNAKPLKSLQEGFAEAAARKAESIRAKRGC